MQNEIYLYHTLVYYKIHSQIRYVLLVLVINRQQKGKTRQNRCLAVVVIVINDNLFSITSDFCYKIFDYYTEYVLKAFKQLIVCYFSSIYQMLVIFNSSVYSIEVKK